MAETKKSSKKTIIILLVIIIALLVLGGAVLIFALNRSDNENGSQSESTGKQIPLEVTAGVLSPDKLKEWNEQALKEMEDNQIPIIYSPTAKSEDGVNFTCDIGNPEGAKYYMYLDLYADTSLEEEVYLSGLIEPGKGITSFTTNRAFPQGETDAVLVFTTVQDDMKTIVAQTMVVLTLSVK